MKRLCFCIFTIILCTGCYSANSSIKKSDIDNSFLTIDYSDSRQTISNVENAIAFIKSHADDFGFKNASDEIKLQYAISAGDDKYYKMQQYYKGIPVYGSSMLLAVDKEDNLLSFMSNAEDILNKISMDSKLSTDKVKKILIKYAQNTLGYNDENVNVKLPNITDNDRVIYKGDAFNEACLAYDLLVDFCSDSKSENYEVIIDAINGEVVFSQATFMKEDYIYDENGEMVETSALGQVGKKEFYAYERLGNLYLADVNRNIETYKLRYNIFAFTWDVILRKNKELEQISWHSLSNLNSKDEVDAFSNIQIAYDFFEKKLSHVSTDGEGKAQIYIVTNSLRYPDNACSSSMLKDNKLYSCIIVGTKSDRKTTLSSCLDVMSHEYTHAIVKFASNLQYGGEPGAINEGYADIFGEIVEQWYSGKCDWIHSNRNLQFPEKTNNPSEYKKSRWSAEENNGDFVHKNSTVLSHAAYLMSCGVPGMEESSLSMDTLAELWYRSILMTPSDCTFEQCRKVVETAANHMLRDGRLTYDQSKCVSWAFFQVGIDSMNSLVDYIVKPETQIMVNDVNNESYVNYTINITSYEKAGFVGKSKSIKSNAQNEQTFYLSTEYPYAIVTLTDNATNTSYKYAVYVSEEECAKSKLILNTTFGIENIIQKKNSIAYSGIDKEIFEDTIIGKTWYSENYNVDADKWGSNRTEFNADGTVSHIGFRYKDTGTYEVLNDNTIKAVYNENYLDAPESGGYVKYDDYAYEAVYQYNTANNTLYVEYSNSYENVMDDQSGNGLLYDFQGAIGKENTNIDIVGIWNIDEYEPPKSSGASSLIRFYDDGTVIKKGCREIVTGTYNIADDNTIEAVYDFIYEGDFCNNSPVLEPVNTGGYLYTVIFQYDSEKDTLTGRYNDNNLLFSQTVYLSRVAPDSEHIEEMEAWLQIPNSIIITSDSIFDLLHNKFNENGIFTDASILITKETEDEIDVSVGFDTPDKFTSIEHYTINKKTGVATAMFAGPTLYLLN